MPRNNLKSFPTAMIRRGLVQFHPGSHATVQAPIDPPGNLPADGIEPPPPFTADSLPCSEPEALVETIPPLVS
jgi:hypothetical protein